jgi:hypothetical protein
LSENGLKEKLILCSPSGRITAREFMLAAIIFAGLESTVAFQPG